MGEGELVRASDPKRSSDGVMVPASDSKYGMKFGPDHHNKWGATSAWHWAKALAWAGFGLGLGVVLLRVFFYSGSVCAHNADIQLHINKRMRT